MLNKTSLFILSSTLFFTTLISGCGYKKIISLSNIQNTYTLSIQMPMVVCASENNGPLLYRSLWKRFTQAGYNIVTTKGDYHLVTKIQKINAPDKFVSPDIVLYGYRMNVSIEAMLFDANDSLVAQTTVNKSSIVSTAKNPTQRQEFSRFILSSLFTRCANTLNRWVQKIWTSKKKQKIE